MELVCKEVKLSVSMATGSSSYGWALQQQLRVPKLETVTNKFTSNIDREGKDLAHARYNTLHVSY